MDIREFGVEQWMNAHETSARWNLAETCCDSLTLGALLELAGPGAGSLNDLLALRLDYGEIAGSLRLRRAIAALYRTRRAEEVLVTHGTIGANALVHRTLVGPGDRVVSVVPTYQQHLSIPDSLGARVIPVALRPEDGWRLDLGALRAAVTPGTRLIALSNPNNPTGALLDEDTLGAIVAIARAAGAWILADEVYRGLDAVGEGQTASVTDLYEKGISTGGMSKAFSLAGLRLGWIAGPAEVLRAVSVHRDYDTISVGRIDDHFAAVALEAKDAILGRNLALSRRNRAILAGWIASEPRVGWVPPGGGTVALLAIAGMMDSARFCRELQERTGVMLLPGSLLGVEGTVRIGYACASDVLREGLARLSDHLAAGRA